LTAAQRYLLPESAESFEEGRMTSKDNMIDLAKALLNCTDEEMNIIKSNPKYMQVLETAPEWMNTNFIFEVEEAHGCICQQQKGQKITVNGDGSIVCKESPEKICVYLLNSIIPIVYGAMEFIFAGHDPNDLKFTRVGCFDVSAKCGGIGHVTVQFSKHYSQ
jgi:uncharacterized repeat protein (TIGR04076 family)